MSEYDEAEKLFNSASERLAKVAGILFSGLADETIRPRELARDIAMGLSDMAQAQLKQMAAIRAQLDTIRRDVR